MHLVHRRRVEDRLHRPSIDGRRAPSERRATRSAEEGRGGEDHPPHGAAPATPGAGAREELGLHVGQAAPPGDNGRRPAHLALHGPGQGVGGGVPEKERRLLHGPMVSVEVGTGEQEPAPQEHTVGGRKTALPEKAAEAAGRVAQRRGEVRHGQGLSRVLDGPGHDPHDLRLVASLEHGAHAAGACRRERAFHGLADRARPRRTAREHDAVHAQTPEAVELEAALVDVRVHGEGEAGVALAEPADVGERVFARRIVSIHHASVHDLRLDDRGQLAPGAHGGHAVPRAQRIGEAGTNPCVGLEDHHVCQEIPPVLLEEERCRCRLRALTRSMSGKRVRRCWRVRRTASGRKGPACARIQPTGSSLTAVP